MTENERYGTFFSDYRKIESQLWSEKWKREKSDFEAFRFRHEHHRGQITQILKRDAPTYNIFGILGLGHYEVRLHSPFLTNLLNPKGSHGQGALFLNSFFKDVLNLGCAYNDISNFKVSAEFPFPKMPIAIQNIGEEKKFYKSGRIDILMRFTYKGKPKAIVIENKIYAKDQPKQLMRYENYALNGFGYKSKDICLVYLAPRHQNPTPDSYSAVEWKNPENNKRYFSISYYNDIKNWLHSCMTDVQSDELKFILQQYLKTIKKL